MAGFAGAQDTTRLSLIFFGDVMQHDSQIADAFDPQTKTYDYHPCFRFIKPYIQQADIAIGNLELTFGGPPYKGYPLFSAPDELITALKDAGVDVLVTANNHSLDRGKKGLERTLKVLDSLEILHTGTFVDEVDKLNNHPLILEKNGFRLALLNYTYGTNGLEVRAPNIVNRLDTAAIHRDLVRAAEMKPDAIIVFTHWGNEYQRTPDAGQKQVASLCFRYGAQMVIGSHPHVIQPMEWHKNENRFVVYSLGNFVSGQRKRYTDGGVLVWIGLEKIIQDSVRSETRIDTVAYLPEWVYRTADAEKNYYVLPVPSFETDTTGFIADENSVQAFKTFIDDTRQWLGKHNVSVGELRYVPPDTIAQYRVLFSTDSVSSGNEVRLPSLPYGAEVEKQDDGRLFFFSGRFIDYAEAEKYRRKLSERFGYKEAVVVEF